MVNKLVLDLVCNYLIKINEFPGYNPVKVLFYFVFLTSQMKKYKIRYPSRKKGYVGG